MTPRIAHARTLDAEGIPSQRRTELIRSGDVVRLDTAAYGEPASAGRPDATLAAAIARFEPAMVFGQSAAASFDLDAFRFGCVPLQIAIPHDRGWCRHPKVQVVRTRCWAPPTMVADLPVQPVVDVLLSLGGHTRPRLPAAGCGWAATVDELVELAVESALRRRLCHLDDLRNAAESAPKQRPGRAQLARVLARRGDAPPTESFLETRALQVLRRHGLPEPERQVDVGSRTSRIGRVDFRIGNVLIETDGHQWHDGVGPDQAHRDRDRWSALAALGHCVQVATWRMVEHEPVRWADRIATALAIQPSRG